VISLHVHALHRVEAAGNVPGWPKRGFQGLGGNQLLMGEAAAS
jgi:hypothetical protein